MHRLIAVILTSMVMAGCATRSTSPGEGRSMDPQAVLGKLWQWETTTTPLEKIEVTAPENYTLLLEPDGRARLRIDCNTGSGSFEIDAGKLTFGPIMSTRMACPPGSLDGVFTRDLPRVVSFFLNDGRLYLELPYDSGTMQFRAGHE